MAISTLKEGKRMLPSLTAYPRVFSSPFRFQKYRSEETPVSERIVALDGSGDFDDIQDALNSLTSEGGSIFVKAGTYVQTSTLIIPVNNVVLYGTGKSTKITFSINEVAIKAWDVTGLIIKDLWVAGSGSGNLQVGIYLGAGSDAKAIGIFVSNLGDVGVRTISGSHIILTNSEIFNNGDFGVHLAASDASIDFAAGPCNNSLIADNYIHDNSADGIFLRSGTNECDNNILSGNRIENNTNNGIRIFNANCNNNVITENIISGSATPINDNGTDTQIGHNIT